MRSLVRYALENGGTDTAVLLPNAVLGSGFAAANPTCLRSGGGILFGSRLVDYGKVVQGDDVRFVGPAINQSYILRKNGFSSRNAMFTISDSVPTDIRELDFGPGRCESYYKGLEDMRLVGWDGKRYAYGTRWDMVPGKARICLYSLDTQEPVLVSVLDSPTGSDCEKNWSAVEGRPLAFVYSWDPFTVAEVLDTCSGKCSVTRSDDAVSGLPYGFSTRGGSQVVGIGDGRMLAVVHSSVRDTAAGGLGRLRYRHAFALLDESLVITGVSDWFVFRNDLCEFTCGLAVQDGVATIPYSQVDCTVNVLEIPLEALMRFIDGDGAECQEYGPEYLESLADAYMGYWQWRSADTLFGAAAAGYGISDPRWVPCAARSFGGIVHDLACASDQSVADGVETRLLEAVAKSGGDWRMYRPLSELCRLQGRVSDAEVYSRIADRGEWLSKVRDCRTF